MLRGVSLERQLDELSELYQEAKENKDKAQLVLAACFIPSLIENLKNEMAKVADLENQLKEAMERY